MPAITLTDASPVQSPVFGGIGGRIGGGLGSRPETPSSGGQNGRSCSGKSEGEKMLTRVCVGRSETWTSPRGLMRTLSSNANAQATSGAQRDDGSGEKPAIDPLSQVCGMICLLGCQADNYNAAYPQTNECAPLPKCVLYQRPTANF